MLAFDQSLSTLVHVKKKYQQGNHFFIEGQKEEVNSEHPPAKTCEALGGFGQLRRPKCCNLQSWTHSTRGGGLNDPSSSERAKKDESSSYISAYPPYLKLFTYLALCAARMNLGTNGYYMRKNAHKDFFIDLYYGIVAHFQGCQRNNL